MNARGTRRPHAKRVRKKAVNLTRGGGGDDKSGCWLWSLAMLITGGLAAYGLVWLAVGAGLLLSRGLAYALALP